VGCLLFWVFVQANAGPTLEVNECSKKCRNLKVLWMVLRLASTSRIYDAKVAAGRFRFAGGTPADLSTCWHPRIVIRIIRSRNNA